MDRYERRKDLKANIDYERLRKEYPYDDIDDLLELMLDTVCSTAPAIRIGGSDIPTEAVRDRFLQLDSEHIQYVIDALKQTTTKTNDIRAYLLTALYNAPVTIGSYYSAAVRHDVTTGADGAVSLRVAPGSYKITEKSVPAPYYLPSRNADREQTISLNPGDEKTVKH